MTAHMHLPWEGTRWWRVVLEEDGSLWCETSSEQESREALRAAPSPARLQRLMRRAEERWTDVIE